jgi:hypothetical protein
MSLVRVHTVFFSMHGARAVLQGMVLRGRGCALQHWSLASVTVLSLYGIAGGLVLQWLPFSWCSGGTVCAA